MLFELEYTHTHTHTHTHTVSDYITAAACFHVQHGAFRLNETPWVELSLTYAKVNSFYRKYQ